MLGLLALPGMAEVSEAHRVMEAQCSVVEPVARAYLSERGFGQSCPGCKVSETHRLEDADGKRVRGVEEILRRYVTGPRGARRGFGVWMAHTEPVTRATLAFARSAAGCNVGLLFEYKWYSTEMMLILPVDGDPESRPSNLSLEKSYLDQMARRVSRHP